MYYNLFLDDKRSVKDVFWMELPPYEWIIIRSYEDFIKILKQNGPPNFVTFDIDLCDEHYQDTNTQEWLIKHYTGQFKTKDGIHCLMALICICREKEWKFPEIACHSLNGVARLELLEIARKNGLNIYDKQQ